MNNTQSGRNKGKTFYQVEWYAEKFKTNKELGVCSLSYPKKLIKVLENKGVFVDVDDTFKETGVYILKLKENN